LTKQLHDDFKVEYREEGAPLRPDDTFNLKKGSCRDLSWMQINLLRQLGIAARFVSGYYYFDMAYELRVGGRFIPGIGWLGFRSSWYFYREYSFSNCFKCALREYDASFGRYSGSATPNY
jgi:hypothetical protein